MQFRAKYVGKCVVCQREIKPGDPIKWSRRTGPKGGKRVYHSYCTEVPPEGQGMPLTPESMEEGNGMIGEALTEALEAGGEFPDTLRESAPKDAKLSPRVPNSQESEDAPREDDKASSNMQTVSGEAIFSLPKEFVEGIADAVEARLTRRMGGDLGNLRKEIRQAVEEVKKTQEQDKSLKVTMVEVTIPGQPEIKLQAGLRHKEYPTLLHLVNMRKNVYAHGPSQSGKSTAAFQVAQDLGLPFYYISLNPQTPDSRLLGFMRPDGAYQETTFYMAYKSGGVFCVDEVDNASDSLLTTLNSAFANNRASFPCGMVDRHKDCIIVATGNTVGFGGTPDYPERRVLSSAFRERFIFLPWPYDEGMETAVALSYSQEFGQTVATYVQKVRAWAKDKGYRLSVTPATSFNTAMLLEYAKKNEVKFADILGMTMFKGIEDDVRQKVLAFAKPTF